MLRCGFFSNLLEIGAAAWTLDHPVTTRIFHTLRAFHWLGSPRPRDAIPRGPLLCRDWQSAERDHSRHGKRSANAALGEACYGCRLKRKRPFVTVKKIFTRTDE